MKTVPPRPVPVPADIEVESRLAGPLTARQCAILAATAALVLAEGEMLHGALRLSPAAVVVAAAPLVVAGALLSLVKPGGVSADRLLRAALRYIRTGRRQADVPEHLPLPAGLVRLAPLYQRIAEVDGAGVVELDGPQVAVVIEARPRCLQLADADEARAVLSAVGTVLAAQSGPLSISTLTERISLDEHAQCAAETAARLGTPQLAAFARGAAEYLRDLVGGQDLWQRRHLITIGEPGGADAAARAAHRARATAQLLEACGINARVLDPAELTALLAAACAPERRAAPRRLSPPDRPVTARRDAWEHE